MRSFRSFLIAIALSFCFAAIAQPHGAAAQDKSPSTQLLEAVASRDGTKVIALLNAGTTGLINSPSDESGETALHLVVRRGDAIWIRFLLDKRAKPDVLDNAGHSPLMIAILNGDVETALMLLERGASVDFVNTRGESALMRAVQLRNPVLVRLLIAQGADPDRADYAAGLSARDYATRDARSATLLAALTPRQAPARDMLDVGPIVTKAD